MLDSLCARPAVRSRREERRRSLVLLAVRRRRYDWRRPFISRIPPARHIAITANRRVIYRVACSGLTAERLIPQPTNQEAPAPAAAATQRPAASQPPRCCCPPPRSQYAAALPVATKPRPSVHWPPGPRQSLISRAARPPARFPFLPSRSLSFPLFRCSLSKQTLRCSCCPVTPLHHQQPPPSLLHRIVPSHNHHSLSFKPASSTRVCLQDPAVAARHSLYTITTTATPFCTTATHTPKRKSTRHSSVNTHTILLCRALNRRPV